MEIVTDRLLLRDFVEEDLAAVLEYQADPRYRRFYREEPDGRKLVASFIDWSRQTLRTKFQLAIVVRNGNRLIGNCGVRLVEPDSLTAEFGCELDPRAWTKGYATEAGRALLTFGFGAAGFRRILAWVLRENGAACRLAERLGMKRAGEIPNHRGMKDRGWDSVLYEMPAP